MCSYMSLCALVYKHRSDITSSVDLIKIMNVGNELYHVLSRLHNQDFLLLTELPNTLTVFDSNYDFQYSASYTGHINEVSPSIDFQYSPSIDFQYYTSFANAMQMLLQENFNRSGNWLN